MMKVWLMLIGGKGKLRYVKAEAPCWKGEVVLPLFGDCIVFGWQRRILMNTNALKKTP